MSMFNDIQLHRARIEHASINNAQEVADIQLFQARLSVLHWAEIGAILELRHDCQRSTKVARDCREGDRHLRPVRTSSISSCCGEYEERNTKILRRNTSIHFEADRENIQVLERLLLSPDQFCMRGFEKLKYSQLVQNFGKIVMEGQNSRVRNAQRLGRVERLNGGRQWERGSRCQAAMAARDQQ